MSTYTICICKNGQKSTTEINEPVSLEELKKRYFGRGEFVGILEHGVYVAVASAGGWRSVHDVMRLNRQISKGKKY